MTDLIRLETEKIIENVLDEDGYEENYGENEESTTGSQNWMPSNNPVLRAFGLQNWFEFFSTLFIILAFIAIIKKWIWNPIKGALLFVFGPLIRFIKYRL